MEENLRIQELEKENQELRSAYKDLTLLHDLAKVISSSHDLSTIMNFLVDKVSEILEYNWCVLMIWDSVNLRYDIGAVSGESPEMLRTIEAHEDEGIVAWAMDKVQPTFLPFGSYKEGSYVISPLVGSQNTIGFLHISTSQDVSKVGGQHFVMLNLLSGQTAIAIENAKLFDNLHEFNEYLNNILNGLLLGVIVLDRQGKVTLMNQNVKELLFISDNPDENCHFSNIFPDKIKEVLSPIFARLLLGEKAEEIETELEGPLGEIVPVSIATDLLLNPQLEMIGVVILVNDLRMGKELKKLKKLDELKSQLLSTVSHELRTPLTSIKAYAETLLESIDEGDKETQKEFLSIINKESDRLSRMIDDLLKLSRIERGDFNVSLGSLNLGNLIKDVHTLFANQFPNYNFIEKKLPNLPTVLADRDKIHQVFINIIGNAVKYSPKGGDIITTVSLGDDFLIVEVQDEGIGIPLEDQEKIFESFFRVQLDSSFDISGTGLGLSISKFIVEAHKGKIWVESKEGVGSSFFFALPFEKNLSDGDQ